MYLGEFKNIKNEDFTVGIYNPKVTTPTKKLIMGTPAFTVSLEGAESNIYKPIKCSSATMKIVAQNYLFDLYSSEAHKNKVVLNKGRKTVWTGYISPNVYSQPYENPYDEIDIECMDALSTLQYFDYETIQDKQKQIIGFVPLINHILSKCEAYVKFNISNSIKVKKEDEFCLAHYCSISESNFFDEDDDTPVTYKDVLEQICTFLNLTCLAVGNEVYFINYDEIKTEQYYTSYTINGDLNKPTILRFADPVIIDKTYYKENGTNISLDKTYNKVSVVAKHKIVKDLMPDIFDDKLIKQRLAENQAQFVEVKRIQLWMNGDHIKEDEAKKREKLVKYQWFDHKYYTEYFYDKTGTPIYYPPVPLTVDDVKNYICGCICKHSVSQFEKVHKYQEADSKLNLSTYLLLMEQHYIDRQLPLFSMHLNTIKGLNAAISKDSRLILSGKVKLYIGEIYTDLPWTGKSEGINGAVFDCTHTLTLPLRIKLGGKYFNSYTLRWQDEEITAEIPLYTKEITEEDRVDNCIDVDLNIKNNITWMAGYGDANGFFLPMPDNITDISDLEITFMNHTGHFIKYSDKWWGVKYAFISDFKAEIIRRTKIKKGDNVFSPTYDDENNENNNDTDTVYENVINENYVEEGDEIQFDICTDDGKANAFSTVLLNTPNGYDLLDKTFDTSTNQNLRQEEQLIYRLVNQYKNPSIIINSTLISDISPLSICEDVTIPDKVFIVDSQEIDYEFDKQEINLIEKK